MRTVFSTLCQKKEELMREEKYLNISDVARLIGKSESQVHLDCRLGKVNYERIGKRIRVIKIADARQYIRNEKKRRSKLARRRRNHPKG